MCLTRILKHWRTARKPVFGQEVFNTLWFVCTNMNIWIFFPRIMITFCGAFFWNIGKTFNEIKFCNEAETIIFVHIRLNSIPKSEAQKYTKLFVIVRSRFISFNSTKQGYISPSSKYYSHSNILVPSRPLRLFFVACIVIIKTACDSLTYDFVV